jgi:hypothetical protein
VLTLHATLPVMTAKTQHVQQLANSESESHHRGSEGNNGDTTFHPLTLGTSLVALEHSRIKNDSAVTIYGENRQDVAKPVEEKYRINASFKMSSIKVANWRP